MTKAKAPSGENSSRRKFLSGAAVAAAATVAAPTVVKAQGPVSMRFQSTWPSKDIFHEFAVDFAKKVNDMTGGDLRIEVLPAGAVVPAFGILDAISSGTLDGGHGVQVYHYGKQPALALWGSGPAFAMDANMLLAWHKYGGGKELLAKAYSSIGANVMSFVYGPMPTQPLGWFKREVTSVDDLRGVKYRTVGLATEVFQRMGSAVTQLPGGEIIPAMERGVIDGFEFSNPSSDRLLGAPDVAKTYMMGSYHQPNESFEIIFNKEVYESLPREQQAILRYAAEAASSANLWKAYDRFSEDFQGLQEEDGVAVHRTPRSIMEAQLTSWDKVIEPLMGDEFFARVVQSQKDWSKRVVGYDLYNKADYKLAYEHFFGPLGF